MTRASPGALRWLAHALIVVAGWLLFVWLWTLVASQPWESRELVLLVVAAMLIFPAVTVAWVVHNLSIHRRLGPRRGLRQVDLHYERDFNGRLIVADWLLLAGQSRVTIETDGAVKRYHSHR